MESLFKIRTGLPYWVNHILVALAIGLVMGQGFLYGAMFYAGREFSDWEKLGYFDHKGFWAPVISSVIAQIVWEFNGLA